MKKGYQERVDKIWDHFSVDFMKNCSVLDCSCGNGVKGMDLYVEKGMSYNQFLGVDVNEGRLSEIKSKGAKTLLVNLEKDDLKKIICSDFDLILCVETLEHLSSKAECLLMASFLSLLKKGGSIAITFPSKVKMDSCRYGHTRQPDPKKIKKEISCFFENFSVSISDNGAYIIFADNKK